MTANNTFEKHKRLLKPKDFHWVYQSKQWGRSDLFTYNIRANQTLESSLTCSRLGITVAKKVSKKAVDRNRLKRQIREFYRQHQHQLNNASLVITANPSSLTASRIQRQQSLEQLWAKVLKWQLWHQREQQCD